MLLLFLGTLFAVSADPSVISFAGGLPSMAVLDAAGIAEAAADVFADAGPAALQYSTTDGYRPLREFIADRYRRRVGLAVTAANIQIVNGSQQCLDLVAKCLVDPGDVVAIEVPGYLGAIEAFSLYEPRLSTVAIGEGGPDLAALDRVVDRDRPKFFYAIPNAQNPSGLTYPDRARRAVAEILDGSETLLYEDDAFGELFFDGRPRRPIGADLPGRALLSGSFSKVLAPGMRCGWLVAPEEVLAKFNVAKQAADLHSNHLCQAALHRWLTTRDSSTRSAAGSRGSTRRTAGPCSTRSTTHAPNSLTPRPRAACSCSHACLAPSRRWSSSTRESGRAWP